MRTRRLIGMAAAVSVLGAATLLGSTSLAFAEPPPVAVDHRAQAASTDSLDAALLMGAGLLAASGATLMVRRRRAGTPGTP